MRLPIAIGILTGLRIGDIVTVPETAFCNGWYETRKRGVEICLPLTAARSCVRRHMMPRHFAQAWTEDGLRCSFAKLKRAGKVGLGLTIHGLRHTVDSELAEHDVSEGSIAS